MTFTDSEMADRERVGDMLHSAIHPAHPWSGCSNPDLIYIQLDRLRAYMDEQAGTAEALTRFAAQFRALKPVPA